MGEAAFLLARSHTGRSGFEIYKKSEGVSPADDSSVRAAKARYLKLPLLLDPQLRELALGALAGARGAVRTGASPLHLTLWRWGATCVEGGEARETSIEGFAQLLVERASAIAPKRTGWVIEPTLNLDGRRTNASTVEMSALFLDCDGAGEWTDLLEKVDALGLCRVAYQSGGWSPTSPKWRIVFPLAQPFDTRGEASQLAWKKFYHLARVTFGAFGGLLGPGFDPSTDTPCCPWFLTEKREPTDPPRAVSWRPGRSLDAIGLTLNLPEIPAEDEDAQRREIRSAPTAPLGTARLDAVVEALARATASVPGNRRDLYLSLTGALLDRGVPPDEALEAVERVSERYPRHHPDKHADNVHCARTTVDKWLRGEPVTRIGTLNEFLPAVAEALDRVLPDPTTKMMADSIEEAVRLARAPGAPTPAVPATSAPPPTNHPRRIKLTPVGKEALRVAKRLKKRVKDKLSGVVVECLVSGVPIPSSSPAETDNLVAIAMSALGRNMHVDTSWQSVLDLASRCLSLMDVTQSVERTDIARRAFYVGQGKRRASMKKREQRNEADRLLRAGDAQKCLL